MTQSTTRPVAIGELQRAWLAVQAGEFRGRASSRSRVRTEHADPRWAPRERVLPVVGCHPQAGASTLAVAIATAAAPARVIECSSATTGAIERAKVSCTGPRTWPQLTPVDMTAPKVRTSKKFWHIHWRARATSSALPLRLSLAGFFFLASVASFSVAAGACSSVVTARFNAE